MIRSHSGEFERMEVDATDPGPGEGAPTRTTEWNYTTSVKLYHQHKNAMASVFPSLFDGARDTARFPGMLSKSAREMLGLTQQDLAVLSGVSRKTINDYENHKAEPGPRILRSLREALEGGGARFFALDDLIGVVVTTGGVR